MSLEYNEYRRYGRQMLLPEVGKPGQLKLKASSALVVGVGGLGCPCIAYLAGAGIGHIGLVDSDTVDISNCHRQILHRSSDVGVRKVYSAERFVRELNETVKVTCHVDTLDPSNALDIIQGYDLVLDCTDNQPTRYLISDACVLLDVPLVSGSALKLDGQLAIYNYKGGPCYRCIFPTPSPPASVQTCGEAGVLGPVVGIIGVMQALEAIKVLLDDVSDNRANQAGTKPKLLLFSAFDDPQWRQMTLRGKRKQCQACGENPTIDKHAFFADSLKQYGAACLNDAMSDHPLKRESRIAAQDLMSDLTRFNIIDVRDTTQFGIVSLQKSTNVPMEELAAYIHEGPLDTETLVVCRVGNDSQMAVDYLAQKYPQYRFRDLIGGLEAYSRLDANFPLY